MIYDSDHSLLNYGFTKIRVLENNGDKIVRYSAGGNPSTHEEPVEENTWYAATITYSTANNEVKYYLNQNWLATYTAGVGTSTPSGHPTVALGTSRIFDRYFDGQIDDIRIYDKVMSPNEIEALYDPKS